METSERTVYRYLDLLKELGFRIEKDAKGRFWIDSEGESDGFPFTPQERDYLERLIKSTGRRSRLSEGILQKLCKDDEIHAGADHLFKAHLSRIVEQISVAIVERRQLLIRSYSSANSQTVTDRTVEPMCFTDDYQSLSAFEPKSMQNKYFNIERMGGVEVLDSPMRYEVKHAFFKPDIFGFQGRSLGKEVELQLSLRASLVLKEDFPMSAPYIHRIEGQAAYSFKAVVQSFKAPGRFVLGFPADVRVLGSRQFLDYLRKIKRKSGVE